MTTGGIRDQPTLIGPGRTHQPTESREGEVYGKAEEIIREASRANQSQDVELYTLEVFLLSRRVSESWPRRTRKSPRRRPDRGDQTLEDLHHALFDAFDRSDEHMYEFQFGKGPMQIRQFFLPDAFEVSWEEPTGRWGSPDQHRFTGPESRPSLPATGSDFADGSSRKTDVGGVEKKRGSNRQVSEGDEAGREKPAAGCCEEEE